MSLKCMIDKWLYKGQISQEEYDAVMKKLEGHNKQIREDAIEECINLIKMCCPCEEVSSFGLLVCGLEQLKEKKK